MSYFNNYGIYVSDTQPTHINGTLDRFRSANMGIHLLIWYWMVGGLARPGHSQVPDPALARAGLGPGLAPGPGLGPGPATPGHQKSTSMSYFNNC